LLQPDGPFSSTILIQGSFGVPGDEDVYAVTNTGPNPLQLRLQTHGDQPGVCPGDTVVRVRDALGVELAFDDDGAGVGLCSRLLIGIGPGETQFVNVFEFSDNDTIALYFLQVQLSATP
jgi:hypothetical protein